MKDLVDLINLVFARNYEELFRRLNEIDNRLNNYLVYIKIEDIKWYYLFGDEDDAKKKTIELIKILNKDEKMNCDLEKLRNKNGRN